MLKNIKLCQSGSVAPWLSLTFPDLLYFVILKFTVHATWLTARMLNVVNNQSGLTQLKFENFSMLFFFSIHKIA